MRTANPYRLVDMKVPADALEAAAERANTEQRGLTDVTAALLRDYAAGRTWLNLPGDGNTSLPLTCDACLHAPATLIAALGRTHADRSPAPRHVLQLLCAGCAIRTRQITDRGGRAVTFLTIGPGEVPQDDLTADVANRT